jgi:hypothetical protein
MESSTVLAFRIFVMLSCLIIVPMAAIFGSAFPDVVKSVLVDRIVALSTGKPVDSAAASSDPNGFRAVTPGQPVTPGQSVPVEAGSTAPAWGAQQAETSPWPNTNQTAGAPASTGTPASPAVVPVGGPAAPGGYNQSASFVVPVEASPQAPGSTAPTGAPPYGSPTPIAGAPAPMPGAAMPGADRTACPLEQPDRFTEMERKLREFGATYYLLETWGNAGELYRFHCRMAVANNAAYSRHFEATDRDALKAMADVLAQVEAWRSGPAQ